MGNDKCNTYGGIKSISVTDITDPFNPIEIDLSKNSTNEPLHIITFNLKRDSKAEIQAYKEALERMKDSCCIAFNGDHTPIYCTKHGAPINCPTIQTNEGW